MFQVFLPIPIIMVLASIFLTVFPFYEDWKGSMIALVIILLGIPVYFIFVQLDVLKYFPMGCQNCMGTLLNSPEKGRMCYSIFLYRIEYHYTSYDFLNKWINFDRFCRLLALYLLIYFILNTISEYFPYKPTFPFCQNPQKSYSLKKSTFFLTWKMVW